MGSPTSANSSGEGFAIKDRMFCESDLTFSLTDVAENQLLTAMLRGQ